VTLAVADITLREDGRTLSFDLLDPGRPGTWLWSRNRQPPLAVSAEVGRILRAYGFAIELLLLGMIGHDEM
jgi:hypothetical protein